MHLFDFIVRHEGSQTFAHAVTHRPRSRRLSVSVAIARLVKLV